MSEYVRKDSPAYKEARNAVQKECENCKSVFMTGKSLNLNKPTLGGGGKKSKAFLGCGVPKVERTKCLEISWSPLSCWLTALTPFWLVLLLTLCRCPKIPLVHFSRSLNTCWLIHVWYTRPWDALNRTRQGGLIPSRGKSGKSLLLNFHQSSLISIMLDGTRIRPCVS